MLLSELLERGLGCGCSDKYQLYDRSGGRGCGNIVGAGGHGDHIGGGGGGRYRRGILGDLSGWSGVDA